ncbi:MAG: hypothetical protein JWM95_2413 [Gemmatimonadetes bacterium]|nr:hypothetical protein [Gemmatimonadota bacterium]
MQTARRRLALALDPALLAEGAGFVSLDPWQRDVLQDRDRNVLLNCSRQSGKSTVSALLAVDALLHRDNALVLIASPTLRQSQELARKVRAILDALGELSPPTKQESTLSLELVTGARLVCLPGTETSARSWSAVSTLIVDEASRCADALYHALRPVLATSRGRVVLLSTPHGRRGFFYNEWVDGVNWHRVRITAHECSRIDPAWLAEERASLPAHVFSAEYLCEFMDDNAAVFGAQYIQAAMRDDVRPLWGTAA